MCKHYANLKNDYLYRGDVLEAVPFTRLDDAEIQVRNPFFLQQQKVTDLRDAYAQPPFVSETDAHNGRVKEPVPCVVRLERVNGVVVSRTCEVNKRTNKKTIPPIVFVAPIRPYDYFDDINGKKFHELVIDGFPSEDGNTNECYRYMALPPCADHAMPAGGIICLREMQPIPIDHLLALPKIARLSSATVRVLDERFYNYMAQTELDCKGDAAAEGDDSPMIAAYKHRQQKVQERKKS